MARGGSKERKFPIGETAPCCLGADTLFQSSDTKSQLTVQHRGTEQREREIKRERKERERERKNATPLITWCFRQHPGFLGRTCPNHAG
ncbi:hypothetical protein GJAV_G00230800 [Gymnothorax javanicus]|nr:hypothetical protein GJAV_G00230800 [Gymnothorax javanicus]